MNFYNLYRPKQFRDILGQDQTISILNAQAKSGDFHHSYLLYGSSGTGKTSAGRILAMALNCIGMNGIGEPCLECPSCRAIQKGSHWDFIEVDGARLNRVDDCRELVNKSYYAPFNSKKKIYLIDEAHRLSDMAWDAMLKTLEEPPPHLVIILCTTDYQKIPETVASRCQLYPFNKMKPDAIRQKLESICATIGVTPDARHMQFIAESSQGNFRTALNILEQVCQVEK